MLRVVALHNLLDRRAQERILPIVMEPCDHAKEDRPCGRRLLHELAMNQSEDRLRACQVREAANGERNLQAVASRVLSHRGVRGHRP